MCVACAIDSEVEYEDSVIRPMDTAFADQFKVEFRDLARTEFSNWLASQGIGIALTQEQLDAYDHLFFLAARCAVRLLNHHDMIRLLEERDEIRGGGL